ncbi:MAG TPA: fused MFS/spermidine synthase [Anaerolineae bacterium]|nr:fused MFS/spermidine synthase [Anaerolineae bacterium]HNU04122.1 fused MFS/spermidine synthase [Anaerolineae bacterium]
MNDVLATSSPDPAAATPRPALPLRRPRYLNLLVLTAGFTTLGVELSGARLLDPWFGNSILVWACLIGLVLGCLSLGYWLGGRVADRWPQAARLYAIALAAALLTALIPAAARPALQGAALSSLSLEGMSFSAGVLLGAGAAIVLLFGLPTLLLGMISPFALRLAVADVGSSGQVAGRLYALSTVGSLLGAFLPVLALIPAIGTRLTFVLMGGLLAAVAIGGLLLERGRPAAPAALALLPLALLGWQASQGLIKPEPGLLHEGESLYNYYQVIQRGPETWLKLNEGIGIHSVYHPQSALSEGIWDYFLIAPLFASASSSQRLPTPPQSLYVVGMAGGTVAQLYSDVYGPIPIDGAELDPEIVTAARDYFNLAAYPNVNAVAADGRSWLLARGAGRPGAAAPYSVIAIDAYRPPYIPFHLATVEFFELVRANLAADGVVAVNAARSREDSALVDALAATMAQVFPSVYVVDESTENWSLGNSLVVATAQPTTLDDFRRNAAAIDPASQPALAELAGRAAHTARPASGAGTILTDDKAPIEQIVHGIMLRYFLR